MQKQWVVSAFTAKQWSLKFRDSKQSKEQFSKENKSLVSQRKTDRFHTSSFHLSGNTETTDVKGQNNIFPGWTYFSPSRSAETCGSLNILHKKQIFFFTLAESSHGKLSVVSKQGLACIFFPKSDVHPARYSKVSNKSTVFNNRRGGIILQKV